MTITDNRIYVCPRQQEAPEFIVPTHKLKEEKHHFRILQGAAETDIRTHNNPDQNSPFLDGGLTCKRAMWYKERRTHEGMAKKISRKSTAHTAERWQCAASSASLTEPAVRGCASSGTEDMESLDLISGPASDLLFSTSRSSSH